MSQCWSDKSGDKSNGILYFTLHHKQDGKGISEPVKCHTRLGSNRISESFEPLFFINRSK